MIIPGMTRIEVLDEERLGREISDMGRKGSSLNG